MDKLTGRQPASTKHFSAASRSLALELEVHMATPGSKRDCPEAVDLKDAEEWVYDQDWDPMIRLRHET